METLLRISRTIDALNERIGRLSLWLVLMMVIVGVWNVLGRYIGYAIGQNLSSNVLIETQWYIFDIVFLLGAAYTLKHNEHVRVDVLYSTWRRKRKALIDFLGALFFLIPFSALIIYFSWGAVYNSWAILENSPDPGGLPRYPIKTAIIVSCVLLILQGISEAIKNWVIFTGIPAPREEEHDPSV